MKALLEKLSFQLESFQEGFDLLSRTKSIEDLAKKFIHIIRGNLLTTDVTVYHQKTDKDEWQQLTRSKNETADIVSLLTDSESPSVRYLDVGPVKVCAILPMIDNSKFAVLIGPRLDKSDYADLDRISLQIFLQLLDNAYQSYLTRLKEKELNFKLNQRALQLNSLIETGIEISKLDLEDSLLSMSMQRVTALTNASKSILTVTSKGNLIDKIYFPMEFEPEKKVKEGFSITREFNFLNKNYQFSLFHKETRMGEEPFDITDEMLLEAFVRQVHGALENQYLHLESLEKQKIDQDISVAGEIQQRILPDQLPDIPGYDISGINIPTKYVGGDYYDCFELKDGRFVLVIADVSGKGVPAALLVSSLHASLTGYFDSATDHGPDLVEIAKKLNKSIYKVSTDDKYITAYFGILDPKTGVYESYNAGHNPIYLLRKNGDLQELDEGGIPIGMMNMDIPAEKEIITIEPGDKLLLYTDGVTEAMNASEEEYDDVIGLKDFFLRNKSETAENFISELLEDITVFTGETPQSDDITALYLTRK